MFHLPPVLIILQVIAIDVSLAGDNAIAVGVAAAGLSGRERHRAVYGGIAVAACLRILFAIFAVQILQVTGLLAAGGLVLLWVGWRMYRDIRRAAHKAKFESGVNPAPSVAKKFSSVLLQIAIADISMSLDNVLAVAGAARNHPTALIIGLALSVLLVGAAAAYVARLTARHGWVAWIGLAIVLYTALHMMWQGGQEVMRVLA